MALYGARYRTGEQLRGPDDQYPTTGPRHGGVDELAREERQVVVGENQKHMVELRAMSLVHCHREGGAHLVEGIEREGLKGFAARENGQENVAFRLAGIGPDDEPGVPVEELTFVVVSFDHAGCTGRQRDAPAT